MSRQVKRMNERSEAKKDKFQVIDHSVMSKPYVGTYQGLSRQDLDWWQYISELVDNTLTIDRDTQCDIYVSFMVDETEHENLIFSGGNKNIDHTKLTTKDGRYILINDRNVLCIETFKQ